MCAQETTSKAVTGVYATRICFVVLGRGDRMGGDGIQPCVCGKPSIRAQWCLAPSGGELQPWLIYGADDGLYGTQEWASL